MATVGASSPKRVSALALRTEAFAKINTGHVKHDVCEQSSARVGESEHDRPQQQQVDNDEAQREEGEEGENHELEQGEGEKKVSEAEQALLADEPPLPTCNDKVGRLAQVAATDPQGIRAYKHERATALAVAAGCNCGD